MKLKPESEIRADALQAEATAWSVPLSQAELDAYLGGQPTEAEVEALGAQP